MGYSHRHRAGGSYEFSFQNDSFYSLQQQVEKRAGVRGIPVIYVNPAYTSKRCYRCGAYGRRSKKRFECPHCGYVAHADVNAAFNIASGSPRNASGECQAYLGEVHDRSGKKDLRRQIREQVTNSLQLLGRTDNPCCINLLAVLEDG